jgi:N-acetyl-gamma-glutamyl-phosphate reductase
MLKGDEDMAIVFIDGSSGTTGLRIRERLAARQDVTVLELDEAVRKDRDVRLHAMARADVAFLCLPDDAAREAADMAADLNTVLIDTSTAHRTDPAWTYGFPELPGQRPRIAAAKRIANPGCHASGFIALTAPLVASGLLPKDAALTCFSLTGYSGGGKKMITAYETTPADPLFRGGRQYGLSQNHKHLPEMTAVTGLRRAPVFCPVVVPDYAGMEVTVPLFREQWRGSVQDICNVYREWYHGPVVWFRPGANEGGYLSSSKYAGRDDMEIGVYGNDERLLLVARFDNLGKGASGAAIQNMNLVLGVDETTGLLL